MSPNLPVQNQDTAPCTRLWQKIEHSGQWVNCLLCKHRDLSSILRSHMQKNMGPVGFICDPCVPMERWEADGRQDSSWKLKGQHAWHNHSKNQRHPNVEDEDGQLRLSSDLDPCTVACTHLHSYTQIHTRYIHTYAEILKNKHNSANSEFAFSPGSHLIIICWISKCMNRKAKRPDNVTKILQTPVSHQLWDNKQKQ